MVLLDSHWYFILFPVVILSLLFRFTNIAGNVDVDEKNHKALRLATKPEAVKRDTAHVVSRTARAGDSSSGQVQRRGGGRENVPGKQSV